jgi:2-polyprenyl-3-methyl-5-hydroxy-6-metoxy-1,4-benzoquinol methylase
VRLPLHYDLPRDAVQRELAERALRRAGAPFDPSNREQFHEGVKRVWRDYQAERRRSRSMLVDLALHARDREEHIDNPMLPDAQRTSLIRKLDRLNRALGAYQWIFAALGRFLDAGRGSEEVSVLDLGSGHGTFPIRLAQQGRIGRHRLRVVGSDLAPAYVAEAQRAAVRQNVAVEFRVVDALALDRVGERFDVLTCTQTVHHFPPELLASMMVSARTHAKRGVLFFDAQRSALNILGVAALGAVASGGDPMFLHDALVSVRRMYSPGELELLARCAPGGEVYRARNFGPFYVVLEAHG